MNTTLTLFLLLNFFCVLILLIILKNINNRSKSYEPYKLVMRVCIYAICSCVSDCIWQLSANKVIKLTIEIDYLLNIIYFVGFIMTAFCWFLYSEILQGTPIFNSKKVRYLIRIPYVILVIISISSYWTGWVFTLKSGSYERGPLFLITQLSAVPCIISSIKAFFKARNKAYYEERRNLNILGSYVYIFIFFFSIQYINNGDVPANCLAVSIIMLLLYFEISEKEVTIDSLTQINNRRQLERYLTRFLSTNPDGIRFYMLIDIDKFKSINDTYGHSEGDEALILMANAMKNIADGSDFIARIGGDEFFFIGERVSVEEIKNVADKISSELTKLAVNNEKPYSLTASIGLYINISNEKLTVPDVLREADNKMYMVKNKVFN